MANFIDFVVEVSKNNNLGIEINEMLQKSTPQELTEWFKTNGFTISEHPLKKLSRKIKNFLKRQTPL